MSLISRHTATALSIGQEHPSAGPAIEVCIAMGRDPFVLLTIDGVLLRAWQVVICEELARADLRRSLFGRP